MGWDGLVLAPDKGSQEAENRFSKKQVAPGGDQASKTSPPNRTPNPEA